MNEFADPWKGSTESIDKFSVWLKETYGGYNVLVNNAGIASELNQDDRSHIDKLVDTVNTNFSGTAYVSLGFMSLYGRSHFGRPANVNWSQFKLMTKLYPLASYNARIVMVSSVFGIRGMFQINANPNKHDGLNDVEQIGVKESDYHFFKSQQAPYNFIQFDI